MKDKPVREGSIDPSEPPSVVTSAQEVVVGVSKSPETGRRLKDHGDK